MNQCYECDQAVISCPDPRTPPLDINDCLCHECFKAAIANIIEELEGELAFYNDLQTNA